jgi:hypothetical protein
LEKKNRQQKDKEKLKKGTKKMKYHTNEENKINRDSIKIRKKM